MKLLVKELLKEKVSLEKRILAINTLLESFNDNEELDNPLQPTTNFPEEGTYLEQIIFVIQSQKRFLFNSEITDILSPYYKDKDRSWLTKRISTVLSNAKRAGEIPNLTNLSVSNQKKDTVWGSIDWLDDKGGILTNYKPMQKEVKKTIKSI